MTTTLEQAQLNLRFAVEQLFKAHPRIQSVGITQVGQDYRFRAVRTANALAGGDVLPQSASSSFPSQIENTFIRPLS